MYNWKRHLRTFYNIVSYFIQNKLWQGEGASSVQGTYPHFFLSTDEYYSPVQDGNDLKVELNTQPRGHSCLQWVSCHSGLFPPKWWNSHMCIIIGTCLFRPKNWYKYLILTQLKVSRLTLTALNTTPRLSKCSWHPALIIWAIAIFIFNT